MGDFFSTLNYSSCNEDWRTEARALEIGPGDRVVAVTGGGDRPLHLLALGPAHVVAVDANPAQTHLLRLKSSAMRALPFSEYVAFLGLTPSTNRRETFERLAPRLAPDTRAFWETNEKAIVGGVLYAGRWERYYAHISRIARALRGAAIERLFAFTDLSEQRAFVRTNWDRAWWRAVYDALCSRTFSRLFLRDPAFFAHVDPTMRVGRYIYNGMLASLDRTLARENFMLSLVFRGVLALDDLPPYLTRAGVDAIQPRLDRLTNATANIIEFLERAPAASFTRFSLSDVPSYLDAPDFERLLDAIVHAAAPGARVCIREFLSAHGIPPRFDGVLLRDAPLEAELRAADRAFAYRFIVATVQNGRNR
jgi:S-adenosylmethionine-diacylglycerol 3-amino-3-carboxypropyl transferase